VIEGAVSIGVLLAPQGNDGIDSREIVARENLPPL